jgi:hypothetical protein
LNIKFIKFFAIIAVLVSSGQEGVGRGRRAQGTGQEGRSAGLRAQSTGQEGKGWQSIAILNLSGNYILIKLAQTTPSL